MNLFIEKIKEMFVAVFPITAIILLLNFTVIPLGGETIGKFIVGTLSVIIGLSLFLFGVEMGIEPIGSHIGESIVRKGKTTVFIISGFVLGFLITVAEPDVAIYAGQVGDMTAGAMKKGELIIGISLGIGVMLAIGLVRIFYDISLKILIPVFYGIVFLTALLAPEEMLGIPFDASGATTGSMTVPFMLALGIGVSSMKTNKNSENDSFGLTACVSIGPILSVLIMTILASGKKVEMVSETVKNMTDKGILTAFLKEVPHISYEVALSLLPIVMIFVILQKVSIKLKKDSFKRILKGIAYTFLGLVLFLTGVNAGFSDAGRKLGEYIAVSNYSWLIIPVGFILGMSVILAEPAVHVLCSEVEEVTGGYIKKPVILFTMAIGVAVAVALSMIKILTPGVELWHYLLVGYIFAIILMFLVPDIFVGMSFDSGGVASGPMSVTFLLAFAQGVAISSESADVLKEGFGIISIIALAPIITMEILGLIYKIKLKGQKK